MVIFVNHFAKLVLTGVHLSDQRGSVFGAQSKVFSSGAVHNAFSGYKLNSGVTNRTPESKVGL